MARNLTSGGLWFEMFCVVVDKEQRLRLTLLRHLLRLGDCFCYMRFWRIHWSRELRDPFIEVLATVARIKDM